MSFRLLLSLILLSSLACLPKDAGCPTNDQEERRAGLCDSHPAGLELPYRFLADGSLEHADELLDDIWHLPRTEPVHLPPPLRWDEDPFNEKYWRFLFYSLRHTRHLLWAFEETGDGRYRDKLVEIVDGFARDAGFSPYRNDKHTVAFRALVLTHTYWKLRQAGALSPDVAERLERTIHDDGAFLAWEHNFEAHYNHGLNQAVALLAVGVSFPGFDEAEGWRALGRERLLRVLEDTIDADGVQVEQSPFYHQYVLRFVWDLFLWDAEHGTVDAELHALVERMVRYISHLATPDGELPLIGSSTQARINPSSRESREMVEVFPEHAFALSGGREGEPIRERLVLFPTAGQAFLRSPLEDAARAREQVHLIFDVGPYRTGHSHLDALAIHLYAHGRVLLPDSGLFSYEPSPQRDYFRGTAAHNTVVVDGRDQPEGTAHSRLSRVSPDDAPVRWAFQSGEHSLYSGVSHARGVLLIEDRALLVLDDLEAEESHRFEQRFHLHPDLSAPGAEAGRVVAVDAEAQPRLAVLQGTPARLVTVRGSDDPVDGWYSESYEQRVPRTVLSFAQEGAGARYATLLLLGDDAARDDVEFTAGGRRDRAHAQLCIGAEGFTLVARSWAETGGSVEVERVTCE